MYLCFAWQNKKQNIIYSYQDNENCKGFKFVCVDGRKDVGIFNLYSHNDSNRNILYIVIFFDHSIKETMPWTDCLITGPQHVCADGTSWSCVALHWQAHTPRYANAHTRTMSFPHRNSQGLRSHHTHPESAELHSHAQGHRKGSYAPSPFKERVKVLTPMSKCNYITENTLNVNKKYVLATTKNRGDGQSSSQRFWDAVAADSTSSVCDLYNVFLCDM